jgi:hypothetical protein
MVETFHMRFSSRYVGWHFLQKRLVTPLDNTLLDDTPTYNWNSTQAARRERLLSSAALTRPSFSFRASQHKRKPDVRTVKNYVRYYVASKSRGQKGGQKMKPDFQVWLLLVQSSKQTMTTPQFSVVLDYIISFLEKKGVVAFTFYIRVTDFGNKRRSTNENVEYNNCDYKNNITTNPFHPVVGRL